MVPPRLSPRLDRDQSHPPARTAADLVPGGKSRPGRACRRLGTGLSRACSGATIPWSHGLLQPLATCDAPAVVGDRQAHRFPARGTPHGRRCARPRVCQVHAVVHVLPRRDSIMYCEKHHQLHMTPPGAPFHEDGREPGTEPGAPRLFQACGPRFQVSATVGGQHILEIVPRRARSSASTPSRSIPTAVPAHPGAPGRQDRGADGGGISLPARKSSPRMPVRMATSWESRLRRRGRERPPRVRPRKGEDPGRPEAPGRSPHRGAGPRCCAARAGRSRP